MSSTSSGTYTAFKPSCCSAALWMAGLRLQRIDAPPGAVGTRRSTGRQHDPCSWSAAAQSGNRNQLALLDARDLVTDSTAVVMAHGGSAERTSCRCGMARRTRGAASWQPSQLAHLWLTGLPTMPSTAVSRRCCFSPYMPLSCCSAGCPGAANAQGNVTSLLMHVRIQAGSTGDSTHMQRERDWQRHQA